MTHLLDGLPLRGHVVEAVDVTLIIMVVVLAQLLGEAYTPLLLRLSLLQSILISGRGSFALQDPLHWDGTSLRWLPIRTGAGGDHCRLDLN